jgi:hypothetical protein
MNLSMGITRVERDSCTGCNIEGPVTRIDRPDYSLVDLCDDCLEKIVKCAGWEIEKEGEASPAIEWRGEAGHFCGAADCVFHLHTHVNGKWCVSTVGEGHPGRRQPMEKISSSRFYESMVFHVVGNGIDLTELEMAPYNDREAAQKGHMALVEKYGGMP